MTHAISQQTKARAAELKRVETTKDDYGFSLTTALPRARANYILYRIMWEFVGVVAAHLLIHRT